MKKEIISEILKFKVLSGYDPSRTSIENESVILERTTVRTLAKDAKFLQSLEQELPSILKTTGALGDKGMLKTAQDVIFALKQESISAADLGKINHAILKKSTNPTLRKSAADWIVSQKSFSNTYSSGTAAERLSLLKQKNPNMSDDMLRDLHAANELKLKNLNKTKSGTKGKPKKSEPSKGSRQDPQVVVTVNQTVENQARRIADDIGPSLDDAAKKYKYKDASDWYEKDRKGFLKWLKNDGKTSGRWGRFANWGTNMITWQGLLGLAKILGIGYGVYKLYEFFTKEGFEVPCPPGEHHEEGKGCVPDGDEDGKKEEDGEGGGDSKKTSDVGPNGEKLKDPQGNKYEICEDTYYKGCVNKKGNTDIKKVQDCLGVTPNGFFNQETEDALKAKINKKSFSPSDIAKICAKSYGGGLYQI